MIIDGQESVTVAVRGAIASTLDPRLREVMDALVQHLHAFIRDVRPTEAEFEHGLGFLAAIGRACTDTHNEAVLFSDAIGASTLVCLLNNGQDGATETAAALLGPFWRDNSPATPDGGSIVRSATPGAPLFARGSVRGPDGAPVAGARVDVWQASPAGMYENQDPAQSDMNLRGRFATDAEGQFRFTSVRPAGYPVPTHGPVGDMLRAQQRHPYRPAHLHFLIHKPGFKTLVTQVFVDDDEHLESDVVFGVTRALVGGFERHDGPAPGGGAGEWFSLDYSFTLEPGEARLPRPPIA
ncbi:catechol 1,2-dioxygenase [Roseomonas hellenica]|uniref:Catechol 1,2-dioxygenase n=1 Tax=Plastoroseomonas hellenica TaxID=2687306 RepID=A0ABS5F931_9PROT|nr:catechol 1,2-dioxygenase [Plastoroseomonas hellenica]